MSFKEYVNDDILTINEGKEGLDYNIVRDNMVDFLNVYVKYKGDIDETVKEIIEYLHDPEYSFMKTPKPKDDDKLEKWEKDNVTKKDRMISLRDKSKKSAEKQQDLEQFRKFLKKIIPSLSKKFGGREMVFVGNDKAEISEEWMNKAAEFGLKLAKKTQRKTTYYSVDKKYKIKQNKEGGNLMGKRSKAELLTLFSAVADEYFPDSDLGFELITDISDYFSEVVKPVKSEVKKIKELSSELMQELEAQGIALPSDNIDHEQFKQEMKQAIKDFNPNLIKDKTLRQEILNTFDDDISEFIEIGNLTKIAEMFQELLGERLNSNLEFKGLLLKESITGELKFGKNSLASPNILLYVDGTTGEHEAKKISNELCEILAEYITVDVSFTSSKKDKNKDRKAYTDFKFKQNFTQDVKQTISDVTKSQNKEDEPEAFAMVTEGNTIYDDIALLSEDMLLTEGFFDSLVAGGKYIKDRIKEIYNILKEKLKTVLSQGFDQLMAYLGVAVDNIKISGDISDQQVLKAMSRV
jgi:hypothetical protein